MLMFTAPARAPRLPPIFADVDGAESVAGVVDDMICATLRLIAQR